MAIGAMAWADCEADISEYWTHVASQEEMPLAGSARIHSELVHVESRFPAGTSYRPQQITVGDLQSWISEYPAVAEELRLLLSISDKRFYLDLSYLLSREHVDSETPRTICGCLPHTMRKHSTAAIIKYLSSKDALVKLRASQVIAGYLASKGALTILDLYVPLDLPARQAVREKWLYPKEAQQNESKRRGHGAEAEVARILTEAGIGIVPENKAANPMGSWDPNINRETFTVVARDVATTFSSDLVVVDPANDLKIMLMGLVQSSDPGQFGVDKAATNESIRKDVDDFNAANGKMLEVWGLIDGIGYSENVKGTLAPMLRDFHHFIQHKSSYKALLGAHRLGLCTVAGIRYDSDFYSAKTRSQMHEKYASGITEVLSNTAIPADCTRIQAGKATVWIARRN